MRPAFCISALGRLAVAQDVFVLRVVQRRVLEGPVAQNVAHQHERRARQLLRPYLLRDVAQCAMEAPSFSSSSPGGIAEDCMDVRVRITVCATSGKVNSVLSAAAAAAKAGTPGVTS